LLKAAYTSTSGGVTSGRLSLKLVVYLASAAACVDRVCELKLLVFAALSYKWFVALSYKCMRPSTTSGCGLKLLVR
jgi:hypothetical protein